MKYSGIDLHSNNSVVTVIDEEDRVVAEKRLPNDLQRIVALLSPWRGELAGIVVESTYNWYWLVDGLQDAGFEVHLANTVAIKKYEGLKHSGDENDARYLAHLLRLGILPTGTILPKDSTRDNGSGEKADATGAKPYCPYSRGGKYYCQAAWSTAIEQSDPEDDCRRC